MNKIIVNNPCIICGKERVVIKTFKEKVGNSVIINSVTACPDKECQKKVEVMLTKEKAHRDEIQSEFRKREAKRMKKAAFLRQRRSISLLPKAEYLKRQIV
jgi:hypothetical protein